MHVGRSLFCLIAVVHLFIQPGSPQIRVDYRTIYAKAEKLSNAKNHSDKTDEAALRMYRQVVGSLTKSNTDNKFLFRANVSTGGFLQVLGRQRESIPFFKNALALKAEIADLSDSVLFR